MRAMVLFARNGIVNTTTADVAKSIRMSHGTVFLHFPRRDDLVIAVMSDFGRRLSAEFRRAFERDLGLRAVLQAHLRVLEEFELFYARLVTEAPCCPAEVPQHPDAAACRRVLRVVHRARARAQGRPRAQIERPLLFNTWIGLVHHYLVNRDVFATGASVIAEQRENASKWFADVSKTLKGAKTMAEKCPACGSCGMPMEQPETFALGDVTRPYCRHCTDARGELLPLTRCWQPTRLYVKSGAHAHGHNVMAAQY